MNILLVSLVDIRAAEEPGIYTDLARALARRGHAVTVLSPAERRHGLTGGVKDLWRCAEGGCVRVVKVRTGNIQKTGAVEKGISTLLMGAWLRRGIRRYLGDVRFSLVVYATPPITVAGVVRYIKRRDGARSYLMLKDIFPQNAADLGMLPTKGPMGLLYRYFCHRERQLYAVSDRIGCMSRANADYLLAHQPQLARHTVGICPNAAEVRLCHADEAQRQSIRARYGLPTAVPIVIYGGNLGKPQGIDFLIACLDRLRERQDVHFVIAGDGTERHRLAAALQKNAQDNVTLLPQLPQTQYESLAGACDIGLILLDHRFTIPNYPSRLLSYLQAGLGVLACTDTVSDVGQTVESGGFGAWCQSNDTAAFEAALFRLLAADRDELRQRAQACLRECFSVDRACRAVLGEAEEGEA